MKNSSPVPTPTFGFHRFPQKCDIDGRTLIEDGSVEFSAEGKVRVRYRCPNEKCPKKRYFKTFDFDNTAAACLLADSGMVAEAEARCTSRQ